jgi:hypothetical protein
MTAIGGNEMKRWYEGLRRGDHAAHIYRSEAEQVRVVTDTLSWMTMTNA